MKALCKSYPQGLWSEDKFKNILSPTSKDGEN